MSLELWKRPTLKLGLAYIKLMQSLYESWTIVIQRVYKAFINSFFYQMFLSRKKGITTAVITVFIILNNQFISTLNAFIAYRMPIYTNIDKFMR